MAINENINKKDLDLILSVNRKAIEIETEMVDQNEEIISSLHDNKECGARIEVKIDKVIKQNDDLSRDIFKMQVLFITGLLALVAQIVQIFLRK